MAALTPEEETDLKQHICDILEVDPDEVTITSRFKEDHDADSMLAIEILAMLERRCAVVIPQSAMAGMVNLEGVYTIVNAARARQ